jgi:molybdopterin converting factor small subunit
MDVPVKLFGGLRHFLPAGSGFNSCVISLDPGANLEALLDKVPVPREQAYMVLLNDTKISEEQYSATPIREGDDVVLLPPIKGG